MKNKKRMMKATAVLLTGVMLLGQSSATVMAAENTSEKEEVVYAVLDGNGNVTGVYVVNSFSGGDIVDYGEYTQVKNLTTTDEITEKEGKITLHTDAEKVYYQGTLEEKEIPWKIEIHYYIDGKEYQPDEIAGKSGALKIHISITQNSNCDESFWKGYALQASMTLDTDKCNNIVAENATIANVGSDKQLSYIVLPGKGADITVTADVTDFEMDAIAINGVKLNLNFELDSQELTDKVAQIQEAAGELDNGAKELKDGTGEVQDGAKSLYNGTTALNSGAEQLNNGVASLNQGISTMQNALNSLNGNSGTLTNGSAQVLATLQEIQAALSNVSVDAGQLATLSAESTQIKTGIDSMVNGLQSVDGSIEQYYNGLSAAGISDVNSYIAAHQQAIQSLEAIGGQDTLVNLLKGDIAYIQGSSALISGIDASLDSQNGSLMQGALALQQNYAAFDTSIQSMTVSLGTLTENMATLKSGIDTLTANYENLDTGIKEYTEAVAQITVGYEKIYQGALGVASGTSELYHGTQGVADGALALYHGTEELGNGTEELADGTGTFREETENMDTEITDTINEKIEELTGEGTEVKSFVSDKNTKVDSVLFVIKTPAIQVQEAEQVVEEEPEETGLWQKFINLFK